MASGSRRPVRRVRPALVLPFLVECDLAVVAMGLSCAAVMACGLGLAQTRSSAPGSVETAQVGLLKCGVQDPGRGRAVEPREGPGAPPSPAATSAGDRACHNRF